MGDDQRAPAGERDRPRLERRVVARRQGNREGKDRAAAGIVFKDEFAAHQGDDALGNGEAETGALVVARVGAVALLEVLEDRGAAIERERRGRCR